MSDILHHRWLHFTVDTLSESYYIKLKFILFILLSMDVQYEVRWRATHVTIVQKDEIKVIKTSFTNGIHSLLCSGKTCYLCVILVNLCSFMICITNFRTDIIAMKCEYSDRSLTNIFLYLFGSSNINNNSMRFFSSHMIDILEFIEL